MVAKISIGSSLYGALSYNGEKINKEQGRVLGSNKIVLPADGKIDIAATVDNFRFFMPKQGKTKKPVLHISLNPHPDDRLTDQDFEILAREYLDKLGFGEQPFIIYKHADIDRHHIHIVTVNVNEQGKRLDQSFLHRRSKKITTELEEKYNLHKAEKRKVDPNEPMRKIDPSGDIKRQVANMVKLAGMRYKFQTIGEYNAVLGLYNIRCETADGRVNGRVYHGLVYFATDDGGNVIANPFKASRLGKFASRTAVEGRFERSKESIDVRPTKRKVSAVLNACRDKQDFSDRLKAEGIDVVFRYSEGGRIYGVTFIDHNTCTVLNGSRLGKEFSANALEQRFSSSPQAAELSRPSVPSVQQEEATSPHGTDGPAPSMQNNSVGSVQSQTQYEDNDWTLPGLDLFYSGPAVNPDEEEFIRRMKRKKKRGRRPKL